MAMVRPGGAQARHESGSGGAVRDVVDALADDLPLEDGSSTPRFLERSGIWPVLAGGCHPARDTGSAIQAAGFEIERLRHLDVKPFPGAFPVAPHILGVAHRVS